MCGIGGSEPAGQQIIQQTNDPWSGVQNHLTSGFARSEEFSNTPIEFYPNSTVVPNSNQTETALGMMENRAIGGSPLLEAGKTAVQQTAAGDFLGASNPHLSGTIDAAIRPVTEHYRESIAPTIDGIAARSGRFGSGMHAKMQETAADTLAQNIGDISAGLSYQNHDAERGRQMQAAQMTPGMSQTDYLDSERLLQVGGAREAQAGAELQDDMDRFYHSQTEPRKRLADHMALINGGVYGGSSTSTAPIYSNPTANTLGTIGAGVGIANGLFGSNGLFPGFNFG